MKLEYLENISNDGKFKDVTSNNLVRLFDFSLTDLKKFRDLIGALCSSQKEVVDLHHEDFIIPLNCSLKLKVDLSNTGITRIGKDPFECRMNHSTYVHMQAQLENMIATEYEGFIWLDDLVEEGNIDFLLSHGGGW